MPLKCKSQKRKHLELFLDPTTGDAATDNRNTRANRSRVNINLLDHKQYPHDFSGDNKAAPSKE